MRIEIRTAPLGPLRVISTLPSARIAMLEGLNGVGKTLAVRLLELCAGEMPYRTDSAAWRSLCSGLGEFSVEMTELHDAQVVRWEGDSRDWSDLDVSAHTAPFRSITVDGRPVSGDEVRRLIRVRRLAGDEDLVETLSQRADDLGDTVRRWFRTHAEADSGPLHQLELRMSAAHDLLGEWTVDRLRGLNSAVVDASDAHRSTLSRIDQVRALRESLQNALRLQRQLQQLETDLPAVRSELARIDVEISTLRVQLEQSQRDITTLAGQVASAGPVTRELTNARRTLARNHEHLARSLDALATRAAEASTSTDPQEIIVNLEAVQQELDEWLALQAEYDQAPAMRELIDTSSAYLAQAESDGLGGQVIIEDPETDLQLTVTEARVGMTVRRVVIEGQPPAPEAAELQEAITNAERRRTLLLEVQVLAEEAARFRRLVEENQRRVDTAMSAFDPSAVARLQALEARRRDDDEQILQLATRRATLVQRAGGTITSASAQQVRADLTRLLQDLALDVDELPESLDRAERELGAEADVQREMESRLRQLRRDFARAEAEIRRTTTALASGDWTWFVTALPQSAVPDSGSQIDQQAGAIDQARGIAERVIERLGAHRGQVGAVESGLRGLARRLRGHDPETRRYIEPIERWLGAQYSEWFNIPRVREELLPSADGPITVDLHNAEARWTEGDVERSRPLEAFSSGEQAFAYTRARLAILDEEEQPVPNRLIVLDEFGAFIAHDRLAALLAYLQDRVPDYPSDQVLVILPLTRDYASLAAASVGTEASRYAELAEQISSQRYALQVLVP